ncbi:hypothetical protein ACTFIW_010563 [Dictyostelium discoideum]
MDTSSMSNNSHSTSAATTTSKMVGSTTNNSTSSVSVSQSPIGASQQFGQPITSPNPNPNNNNNNSTSGNTPILSNTSNNVNVSPITPSSTTTTTTDKKKSRIDIEYKFEDYEDSFFAKAIINDPLKISVIPDLLSLTTEKRVTNLVGNNVPTEVTSIMDKLPKGVQESLNIFNQDWTVVTRDPLPPPSNSQPLKPLQSQNYSVDGEFDSISPTDSVKDLNPDIIAISTQPTPDQKSIEFMKSPNRIPLFQTCYINDESPTINPPKVGKKILENIEFQFKVECTDFKPQIGNFEPFFGRMFIFDANKVDDSDSKSPEVGIISEEFHFDLGTNLDLLPKNSQVNSLNQINPLDNQLPTKIQKCIFSCEKSSDLYLVICFDKVILGDPEETTKHYFNPPKAKELTKIQSEVKEGVSRLGKFKQPFIWGCVELFDQNRKFNFDQGEAEIRVTNFIKAKSDQLHSFVSKEKKSSSSAASKDPLFECILKILQVSSSIGDDKYLYNENVNGRVDYLLRTKIPNTLPPQIQSGQDGKGIIKEILHFNSKISCSASGDSLILKDRDGDKNDFTNNSISNSISSGGGGSNNNNTNGGGGSNNSGVNNNSSNGIDYHHNNSNNNNSNNNNNNNNNHHTDNSCNEELILKSKEPHLTFSNVLYFYPKSVNLTNFKSDRGSARNIFLEVKLMEDDSSVTAIGMKNTHGTSTTPILTCSFLTSVVYHNKKPKFSDEIKINLPSNLTANHHLLVTFYHLGCKKSKKSENPMHTPLGYSVVRLFEQDRIICDGKYKRPVGTVFPPRYLAQEAKDIKDSKDTINHKIWVDNKKPVFSFKTRVISSLYPQDPTLAYLLKESIESNHTLLNENIKKLPSVPNTLKTQFFPSIIRLLFKSITSLSAEVSANSFNVLLNLLDSVPEDVLTSYITYVFNSENSHSFSLYDNIIQVWNQLLEGNSASTTSSSTITITTTPVVQSPPPLSSTSSSSLQNSSTTNLTPPTPTPTPSSSSSSSTTQTIPNPNQLRQDDLILLSIQYSWFLFGIIKKSMIADIQNRDQLKSGRNRTNRFSEEILNRFSFLFDQLLVQLKGAKQLVAKVLIVNIGHFINDLLDIMSRGFVFRIIRNYIAGLDCSNTVMELTELKSRLFRVLASNDSFIALNSPAPISPFPSIQDLFQVFYRKHFIIGLMLQEVSAVIPARDKEMRLKVINTLREIISKIDTNPLYNSPAMRERIAALFFPLLPIIVYHYDAYISKFDQEEQRSWLTCFIYIVKNLNNTNTISDWWKKETPRNNVIFFQILTNCLSIFDYAKEYNQKDDDLENSSKSIQTHQSNLSLDANTDSPGKKKEKPSKSSVKQNVSNIKPDKAKQMIEQQLASSTGMKNSMNSPSQTSNNKENIGSNLNPNSNSINGSQSPLLNVNKDSSNVLGQSTGSAYSQQSPNPGLRAFASSVTFLTVDFTQGSTTQETIQMMYGNLCQEVTLTVLNAFTVFVRDFKSDLLKGTTVAYTDHILFRVILQLLKQDLSFSVIKPVFSVLATLVGEFKHVLFKQNNSICENLTQLVFKYCCSRHSPSRQYATTLIYLMIYNNLKEMGHFSRMKLHSTVAISQILNEIVEKNVQTESVEIVFSYLYACLDSIAKFVKQNCNNSLLKTSYSTSVSSGNVKSTTTTSTSRPSIASQSSNGAATRTQPTIAQQIDELKERLFGVIKNNVKIMQHSYDPEMKADLYYNLSNTFIESPDLRITLLKSFKEFLKQQKSMEEAAQVSIIAAALVSGYLKLLNRFPKELLATDFTTVSPNVANELTLPDLSLLEDVEGEICKLDHFTDTGFINLLKDAIQIQKSGYFESAAETYRLLLPTYQHQKDWTKQRDAYQELVLLCNQIISENVVNQRIFSNYYRVAFYCQDLIPDLHGKEFVYKENNYVRLSDLSERLKKQYCDKFGEDKFHLLPNNKPVDLSSLDVKHIYIQIISVDPYLLPEELKERTTPFQQNTHLNKFIFEIPFTKNGKTQYSENVTEQWKKKIILTTPNYFPYLKKRLPIVKKEEIELTPIEASIELIQKKVTILKAELNSRPANTKTLQIHLQGCLLLQVNAGPLAICSSFLAEGQYQNHNAEHIQKLSEVIKDFSKTLDFGLKFNASLTKEDGVELQKQLDSGYDNFRKKLQEYVKLGNDYDDF